MASLDSEAGAPTPQESVEAIHTTMDKSRSSMYVAGAATILLFWTGIASVGIATQSAVMALAPDFTDQNPWFFGVLWGGLMGPGMAGTGVIGRRAGEKIARGDAARSAGIRVLLYWLAVAAAMVIIPVAAGMNAEDGDSIAGVTIGIASLGHILFGIMYRPALAVIGVGFATAFYIPYVLLDDLAMPVSGGLMLAVLLLGAWWIRKSGDN